MEINLVLSVAYTSAAIHLTARSNLLMSMKSLSTLWRGVPAIPLCLFQFLMMARWF